MITIGISGGTCSGKSTLAEILTQKLTEDGLSVKQVNMDSYFKEVTPTTISPITRIEYPEHNHPTTLDLDRMYADFDKLKSAAEYDILIVEGLFALHIDRVRDMLDYKIYVDLPSDERFARRLKRFSQAFGQEFDDIANRYLDTVRYRHNELVEPSRWHADLVINGALNTHKGIPLLMLLINQLVLSDKK